MSVLNEASYLKNQNYYKDDSMYLPMFPEPMNGQISSEDFLAASKRVVIILDYFGKIFMPAKYDMEGNINKLDKKFNNNRQSYSTLQKMIIDEKNNIENPVAIEALLWLKRALHMIQLFFEYIVHDFDTGKRTEDLVAYLKKSYELTLEPYHGYMAQQLFNLLSRMIPTRTQLLKAIANGYDVRQEILIRNIDRFTKRLKQNITTLNDFYNEHNLENPNKV